jgi:hypothetical protein
MERAALRFNRNVGYRFCELSVGDTNYELTMSGYRATATSRSPTNAVPARVLRYADRPVRESDLHSSGGRRAIPGWRKPRFGRYDAAGFAVLMRHLA